MPHPLPWYIAGPLIGLVVPALLLIGNKSFGFSSNFRHMCAVVAPGGIEYLRHDWKRLGSWNLAFLVGAFTGALIASQLAPTLVLNLSDDTVAAMHELGLQDFSGLAPRELFSWSSLLTFKGLVLIVGGGFLVGFGTSYAGGCTSGHAITGIADLQWASLVATIGFFGGGLLGTFVLLPWLLG